MFIKEELDLNTFEAWSGAVATLDKIKELGLTEQAEEALGEVFPDGASRTEINDMLWFEPEFFWEYLGIASEDSEEE